MKERSLSCLLKGMESPVYAVREVSVRALYELGKAGFLDEAYTRLRTTMLNRREDERVRYYATEGLVSLRMQLPSARQEQLANDLITMADEDSSVMVQLRAAWGLGHMYGVLPSSLREKALRTLSEGFRAYGDGCDRADAAFGWRVFGNSVLQYHRAGREVLEQMRTQSSDKWLAWLAYEVEHLPHRSFRIVPIDERQAIETHERYAPSFPGYRRW